MDFVAGCIGGTLLQLGSILWVRLQVQRFDKPLYRGTFHCFQSIVRQESVSQFSSLYLSSSLKSSSKKLYKNSLDCLLHIYRREGLRGINRGMVTTLVREAPAFGMYFWTYAVLTQSLGCEPNDSYVIPKLLFSVDVIKSRLQADGVGGVNQYSCIEGYMVFTRSLTSTLLRAFPVNAAIFATVSLFKGKLLPDIFCAQPHHH
uniref:Solute carrier family 25 member 29 n=1 Tax=Poecilia reticulata TaxID=8081 RepID=A0A3P9PFT0_POERE